jgi:hypothetical protein
MTKEDIIRMAREAGLATHVVVPDTVVDIFEKFASFVAAHEREECAKLADSLGWVSVDDIRARGKK